MKVSIQGYEGSFHQEAAMKFFGNEIEIIPCASFREVIQAAQHQENCDGAVMAIENSIVGSILPNYQLLQKSKLHIVGEVYLHISQNLMVNPGVALSDLQEIHSHPMALQQCMDFLNAYPWKLVETEDTAGSAQQLQVKGYRHVAAIGSLLAAKRYQLEVVASNIQTHQKNYTRFLILHRSLPEHTLQTANKASVQFHTDHTRGSLANVLQHMAQEGINLSKLQSVPISNEAFRYSFHADMEFEDIAHFQNAIASMGKCTVALHVYGIYQKGNYQI